MRFLSLPCFVVAMTERSPVADEAMEGVPRWVKVGGVIGGLVVLAVIVLHLLGYGFGGHGA
jgi:uncharacterized membrane protein YdcZ (DUF606 family)